MCLFIDFKVYRLFYKSSSLILWARNKIQGIFLCNVRGPGNVAHLSAITWLLVRIDSFRSVVNSNMIAYTSFKLCVGSFHSSVNSTTVNSRTIDTNIRKVFEFFFFDKFIDTFFCFAASSIMKPIFADIFGS